eukprot:2126349-Rhodomonas_salina.1
MIREGKPCKLYFDVEWMTTLARREAPAAGDMTISAIKEIISRVVSARFPDRSSPAVIELDGSREVVTGSDTRAWKHSFHLIYPDLVFRCNNGRMKEVAREVRDSVGHRFPTLSTEEFPTMSTADPNPVDLRVYSKDQLYRAPLCHKRTDASQTRLVAPADAHDVRFFDQLPPQRQRELMQFYSRAFVTD